MILVTYNQPFSFKSYNFSENIPYLCDELWYKVFLANDSILPIIKPINYLLEFDVKKNWNFKKILIIKHGAFGDLLFLTPIIAEIKRRWKNTKISICCAKQYSDAIINNIDIDSFIPYPIQFNEANSFDAIINFANSRQSEILEKNTHIIDIMASLVDIKITDKTIKFNVNEFEILKAIEKFPKSKLKRIGIQVFASNAIRSYPFFKTLELIDELLKYQCEVFLFGSDKQVLLSNKDKVVNLTALLPHSPSFIESAAIMKTCDLFIAPDSSLCHIAGALEIPTIALYGSFPSKLRTAYASTILSIDGKGNCAPCFHHTFNGRKFPENMPCEKSGYCNVLGTIDPKNILEIISNFFLTFTLNK